MNMAGKEYSKGDSRYAARDSCVVTVEGITVVLEGPASLLAVYVLNYEVFYLSSEALRCFTLGPKLFSILISVKTFCLLQSIKQLLLSSI